MIIKNSWLHAAVVQVLEAYLNLDDKYKRVCNNIDEFAEKQDGYVFFNWLNIDEIRGLKE